MKLKLRHYIGPAFGLVLFVIAMWALRLTLHKYHYHDIIESLSGLTHVQVLAALLLTAGNYLVLTFYDTLAFRTIKLPLAYHRIALGSFLGYVFSHNIGLSVLGSGAARYRVYSSWGISAVDTVKVVVFCGVTFWIGFFVLEGLSLQFSTAIPPALPISHGLLKYVGTLFLALIVGYLLLTLLRRRPVVIGNWHFAVPGPTTAILQIGLSCLDWMLAGSVLYVLLPRGAGIDFVDFMGVFLLAECAALCSHVPGGLGVLEIVVPNLMPQIPVPAVLGTLLVYRGIYYLLPLALGTLALASHEVAQGRKLFRLIRLPQLLGEWAGALVPRVLSVAIFIGGALLVLSAAVPSSGVRMHWLGQYLPPQAVDISHFVAALAGAALMLLARSLQRRVKTAYYLTSGLLVVGIAACLGRSWHYEEAIILTMILAVLLPCRREFYRSASVVTERFTPAWIASMAAVIFSAVWLAMFSHKNLLASITTWNDVLSHSATRRFIHTSMGIATVVMLYAAIRLLRPRLPAPAAATTRENMDKVRRVIAAAGDTTACLALAGDKSLMFSPSGDSFLMYAVQKRSWIAMGDPVGKDDECVELIWRFGDLADKYDGWPVFYQAGAEKLPLYLDMGLTSLKLGEEAHVELADFSLEGPAKEALRRAREEVTGMGCDFEVVPVEAAPTLLGQLREVADQWLSEKGASEKGFSRGFFSEQYLSNFPAAVVKKDGAVLAFANLLSGAGKSELSIDLMRYRPGLIHGLMDYLLIGTMLWGRREGYQWFNLGLTPLADYPSLGTSVVPGGAEGAEAVWNTLGGLMFRYGEHFSNFHSLRRYKEKFFPIWHPKYLVTPGGLALPRILANLAELLMQNPLEKTNLK